MFSGERLQKILEQIEKHGNVRITELSKLLDTSEATIRRDLDHLQRLGQLQRIHGGAVLAKKAMPERPVVQRSLEHASDRFAYPRRGWQRLDGRHTRSLAKYGQILCPTRCHSISPHLNRRTKRGYPIGNRQRSPISSN